MADERGRSSDLERFDELESEARLGGGEKLQRRQRRLERMLARERVDALLDPGSFVESGMLQRVAAPNAAARTEAAWGDGVVCGIGTIDERPVAVYAHDATVLRGSVGVGAAQKIIRLLEQAMARGIPVIALHDSDGVRLGEGPRALAGFAQILGQTARLSGSVPQIGVVLGICVGGAAYSSALQDVIIGHTEQGYLFVTGAKVTQVVTGEDTPIEELGGVGMHAKRTGLVHLTANEEAEAIALARQVLGYLPQNAAELPPFVESDDPPDRLTPEVTELIPEEHRKGYDVRKVIRAVFDEGSFLELQKRYAGSILVGFARLEGRAVGVVASQPIVYAGCLDTESSRKAARFVQLCNAFGLPIVTLADVPGFLPGKAQEQAGLLLHGAKLISAYAACTVPMISIVLRKSYGGGNVLAAPADVRLALPYARVQPMGTDAAVKVAGHSAFGDIDEAKVAAFEQEFAETYGAMELAAETGFVDRVIHPDQMRAELCRVLRTLPDRLERGLPGNTPNMPL